MDDIKIYYGYVYLIYNNFDNNVYVGETIQTIEKRFKQHIYESTNPKARAYNFKLSKAIRKYGYSNFFVKEIDKISGEDRKKIKEQIQELEKLYVKKYDSYKNGYNSDEGGLGGKILPDELKKRLSEIKKNDPKTKERMEKARSCQHLEKATDIYNYCTGEHIASFNSLREAAEYLGLKGTDVTKLCKHKQNYRTFKDIKVTCRYKGEPFYPPYTIEVYTDDNSINERFVFAKDGSIKYNVDNSSIIRCCKGKVQSAGSYNKTRLKWRYINGAGN